MYLDYLREKEQELENIIRNKNKEISSINIKIRENDRFYDMIEKSKAVPFTEFTPQIITAGDKKKQEDLSLAGEKLRNKKASIESEIDTISTELSKVKSSITEIKKAITEAKKSQKQDNKYIISSLKSIEEKSLQDPRRANLEIRELLKRLENN